MARPKKPKAAKGKAKGKADPKKRARKTPSPKPAPTPKLSKPRTPAKRPKASAPKAAPKPARKAAQPAQKAPRKPRAAKRPKKLSRAYEGRLRRAQLIADALGLDTRQIRNIARGHPDRDAGEMGLGELRQLKAAAALPSPGEQREKGVKNPQTYPERDVARSRVVQLAGLDQRYLQAPNSTERTRRSPAAERFAEVFVALGLGTEHQAYTLWFSP